MGRIRDGINAVTDSQERFGETMETASQTMVVISVVAICALLLAALSLAVTITRD